MALVPAQPLSHGRMQRFPTVSESAFSPKGLVEHQAENEQNRHPDGAVGPEPDNAEAMIHRLREPWDPEARLAALRSYALSHHGPSKRRNSMEQQESTQEAALAILQQVYEEGMQLQNITSVEMATMNQMKHGMREFLDYAIDEVDRFTHANKSSKSSAANSFSWRSQGDQFDVPALRRSITENAVQAKLLQAMRNKGPQPVAAVGATHASERFSVV